MSNHHRTCFQLNAFALDLETIWVSFGALRKARVFAKEVSSLLIKESGSFGARKGVARPRLVAPRKAAFLRGKAESTGGEFRLHVVIDRESFLKLQGLKAQLEALSEGEIIRRALKAYEIFKPADEAKMHSESLTQDGLGADVEHLYVRIPLRMKERLDIENEKSGYTYTFQVRQALRVLTQLTRKVEAYKLSQASSNKRKGVNYGNEDTFLVLAFAAAS